MLNLKSFLYTSGKFRTSRYKSTEFFEESTVPYFDHYVSHGKEIVSAPVYNHHEQLKLPSEFVPAVGPARVRETELPNTYNDRSHFLVLVTMFLRETNEQLLNFFNYYRSQGVTKFFMFYNGNSQQRYTHLPQAEDVVYQDWNYGYWVYDSENQRSHHCQYQAITTGYYKYGHVAHYVIVCDTDEYIKHPTITLKEYLEQTTPVSHFYIREIPCFIDFSKQKVSVNIEKYNNIMSSNSQAGAKSIYPGPLFSEKYSFKKKMLSGLPIHVDRHALFNTDLIMYHNRLDINKINNSIDMLF